LSLLRFFDHGFDECEPFDSVQDEHPVGLQHRNIGGQPGLSREAVQCRLAYDAEADLPKSPSSEFQCFQTNAIFSAAFIRTR
jgi:hypothetical protein